MEASNTYGRFSDGLVHPKLLQDSCLEYLASLMLESLEAVHITSREQAHEEYYQQEGERQGRMPSDFQPDDRVLRNLKSSIGMEQLLGPDGTLPAHICDRLLAFFASKDILRDPLIRHVGHRGVGCVTKLPRSESLEFTADTLSVLVQQPLVELFLRFYTRARATFPFVPTPDLSTILVSSTASSTLRSLSISNLNFSGHDVGLDWLGGLKSLMRLQFENCNFSVDRGSVLATEVEKLPFVGILMFSDSNCITLPCKCTTLKQLTVSNAYAIMDDKFLADVMSLTNLIYLDIARTTPEHRFPDPAVHGDNWVMKLAHLPHLKYLDMSCRLVSVHDIMHFDHPHHRMNFIGLLSTQACMRKGINSNVVSLHNNK